MFCRVIRIIVCRSFSRSNAMQLSRSRMIQTSGFFITRSSRRNASAENQHIIFRGESKSRSPIARELCAALVRLFYAVLRPAGAAAGHLEDWWKIIREAVLSIRVRLMYSWTAMTERWYSRIFLLSVRKTGWCGAAASARLILSWKFCLNQLRGRTGCCTICNNLVPVRDFP